MLNWEEIVQDYIIKHSDQIKKATDPLKESFGIKYFTYHRIDDRGNYTVLVDSPEYAEHYVQERIYLSDPYLRHPDNYQAGIFLFGGQGSKDYKRKVLQAGKQVLDMDVGIVIIEKQARSVEFFGFGSNSQSSSLEHLALNQPALLKLFGHHFKGELFSVLRDMEESPGFLPKIKGEDYFSPNMILTDFVESGRLAYLEALGFANEIAYAQALSAREKECLLYLLEGKSAKETGFLLTLSPRTVEFYLENVKHKLSCITKRDVFEKALKLCRLGLLLL